jgi:hypothetical protein
VRVIQADDARDDLLPAVITLGSQSKLVTTVWASKDANFGITTIHWYSSPLESVCLIDIGRK